MKKAEIREHLEKFLDANHDQQRAAIANIYYWTLRDRLNKIIGKFETYTSDFHDQRYGRELIYGRGYGCWRRLQDYPKICLELGFIEAAMEAQRWINLIDSSKS